MHFALGISCNNIRKFVDWEKKSVSKNSLEENKFRASLADCQVSAVACRNLDLRHPLLTILAFEPHGQWRIFALSLECLDHMVYHQSESYFKMDGLHLASPSVVSVRVDQQNARRGPACVRSSSVKSLTGRSLSGSSIEYHSRSKGLSKKVSRQNTLPDKSSCQISFSNSDSSVTIPSHSDASNLSDVPTIDVYKVDKAANKNSRKNTRKKGKRNKKLSHKSSPTEQGSGPGSSASEISITKNTDNEIGSLPHATRLASSSPKHVGNGNDSESSSCTINYSGTSQTYTSFTDEVNILEANRDHLSDSENGIKFVAPGFSSLHGEQDTHSNPHSCFNKPCSSIFSKRNDPSMLGSNSVCSNDDVSRHAGYHIKESNKDINGINLSEPSDGIENKQCFSPGNKLNDVIDCCYQTNGSTSCEQRCKSGDMTRSTNQIKQVPRNSGAFHLSNVGKFYGRSGKENNHSIWQKVQRSNTNGSSDEQGKVNSADIHSDIWLNAAPMLKKNNNVAQSSVESKCEDKSQSKVKATRKLKRKSSSGMKQEINCYSRKGTFAIKESSNACVKINTSQNEICDIPGKLSLQKGVKGVSRCRSKFDSQRIGSESNSIEPTSCGPDCSLAHHHSELELLEHACDTIFSLNDQFAKEECSLPLGFCDHQVKTELQNGNPPKYFPLSRSEEDNQMEKDVSHVSNGKPDHSSGSISQKWMPVGIKQSGLAGLGHSESSKLAEHNKPAIKSLTLRNTKEMDNGPDSFVNKKEKVTCPSQGSRDDNDSHSDSEVQPEKHKNRSTCSCKESYVNHVEKCLCDSLTNPNSSPVKNDSDEIAQAVNDAYRTQLASEAVQTATGYPIAEFERFVCSAAPVISLSTSFQDSSHGEIASVPLNRHKIPSITLGSLWQWYEKHGTYGLEVRADDFENTKRFGIDCFTFRAYFVPYLSAVQLFRRHNSCSPDSSKRILGKEDTEAHNLNERLGNSCNIGSLPIFSVLVPQPQTEDLSSKSPRNCVCYSETSSLVTEGNTPIPLDNLKDSVDLEILFEYFEVEQPQKRRPLFETVKELARGDGPSQCGIYGDPTKLYSVALNDLHPKSWYSVAWYPIYRIPDGNFRAAFLTYHSLGHLVHTSAASHSFGKGACVVSPVVGLQSYNAQGECWFQPRQSTHNQILEIINLKPSEIVKERLRTLEQTASLMARAVVTKGSQSYVNRQPDYEFFLSRQRW
ncbi:hypothetical protein NMG60_11035224 [Bertholletia excelsa]